MRLDPLRASTEARSLGVEARSGSVTISDVLVGDVWIAGGQSNMGRNVNASLRPDGFEMDYPLIRFLHVVSPGASYPTVDLEPTIRTRKQPAYSRDNGWNVCVGDVGANCTAVGFFFAQKVHEATGVPQGLLWNAVAGSTAKEWIPRFGWWLEPELAETARVVDSERNVAVVATYDIDPRLREAIEMELAMRASRWAVATTLHWTVRMGPTMSSVHRRGDRIVVRFENVGRGLMAGRKEPLRPFVTPRSDSGLAGFQVAGKDGRWRGARAVIRGDTVEVSADGADLPVRVRYAWGPTPKTANLYNREGFLALPFQANIVEGEKP